MITFFVMKKKQKKKKKKNRNTGEKKTTLTWNSNIQCFCIKKTALSLFNSRTRIWKPRELIEGVVNEPMLFAPGEKSAYNNTNYVLLGMIAEKATGESAEVLLDRYIFTPLGMNDTYLRLIDSE